MSRPVLLALGATAIVVACGDHPKGQVDQSKIGAECFILNGSSNCPPNEQCVSFPAMKTPHCAKDPCGAIICPGGSFCTFVESLPGAVGCF